MAPLKRLFSGDLSKKQQTLGRYLAGTSKRPKTLDSSMPDSGRFDTLLDPDYEEEEDTDMDLGEIEPDTNPRESQSRRRDLTYDHLLKLVTGRLYDKLAAFIEAMPSNRTPVTTDEMRRKPSSVPVPKQSSSKWNIQDPQLSEI